MRYLHIWGCLAHILKGKSDKLEPKTKVYLFVGYLPKTKVYLFVGYLKETKHDSFYNLNNKLFVCTKDKILRNDYMNNFTPKSRVVLVEMS